MRERCVFAIVSTRAFKLRGKVTRTCVFSTKEPTESIGTRVCGKKGEFRSLCCLVKSTELQFAVTVRCVFFRNKQCCFSERKGNKDRCKRRQVAQGNDTFTMAMSTYRRSYSWPREQCARSLIQRNAAQLSQLILTGVWTVVLIISVVFRQNKH